MDAIDHLVGVPMKRRFSILLALALIAGLGSNAPAGPLYEDGQSDAFQSPDLDSGPYPTGIDIKSARFIERGKRFTFRVNVHEPVGTGVFCTDVDCGDHANRGYLEVDFHTEKKNGDFKRYYFFEIRATDGDGMKATLREYSDKGSEIVKLVGVVEGPTSYSVSVRRRFLRSMVKGARMFWNSSSVFWWDPLGEGDYCNFIDEVTDNNACIDFIPEIKDAKVKLKK